MLSSLMVMYIQEKWDSLGQFLWGLKSSKKDTTQPKEQPTEKTSSTSEKLIREVVNGIEGLHIDKSNLPKLPAKIEAYFNELNLSDLALLAQFLLVLAKQGTPIEVIHKIGTILIVYSEWIMEDGDDKSITTIEEILKRNSP